MNRTLGIVGCGNLGEAIARGLIAAGTKPSDILASHPREARRRELTETLGIRTTAANDAAVHGVDITLLAVKPQMLAAVLPEIASAAKGRLVVSLAAGIPTAELVASLPGARIVRAMPNTPAAVRAGATGLFAGAGVSDEDRAAVAKIFDAVGEIGRASCRERV